MDKKATIAIFATVQKEGERIIKRDVEFYNLDTILSIGYRVNSKQATQFRIWATKTLKNHLIKGYTVNEKRLLEAREKFQELQTAISFLQEKSGERKINDNALVALALLVAESDPKEKETMVKIVKNLLTE